MLSVCVGLARESLNVVTRLGTTLRHRHVAREHPLLLRPCVASVQAEDQIGGRLVAQPLRHRRWVPRVAPLLNPIQRQYQVIAANMLRVAHVLLQMQRSHRRVGFIQNFGLASNPCAERLWIQHPKVRTARRR